MLKGLRIAPWAFGYRPEWLRTDVMAGVSVAAVAVPVAMAYSQVAGLPPVYGLYASLLPLVAYALLGTSRQLIIAPDAATCAIIASIIAPLAGHDVGRAVSLASALAIVTGVACIVCGFARLGFLTNFLARPILAGYLNGIAICIIMGQLGGLFGFSMEPGGVFRLAWQFISKIGETHLPTLAVGGSALAVLIVLGRFVPKAPGPLIVMVMGIAASALFGLSDHGIRLLGAIPAGLPPFTIPAVGGGEWQPLIVGALGLALVSYSSGMVTARGFAAKQGYDIDPNREFIALGVANIGSGVLQGYAVTGADSRTAMNDAAGGKTQLVGLVAAVMLALTLVFLTRPLAALPLAVLSAVLVKAAMGLFDLHALANLYRINRYEFRLCILTLLGVITVGVLPGVIVAVMVAIVQLLVRASKPHDAVCGRIPETDAYHDVVSHPEAELIPGIVIYRFDASLVFFNADHFKARALAVVRASPTPVRHLILDAEIMPFVDTTGIASLEQVYVELRKEGIGMAIAAARSQARATLDRAKLSDRLGPDYFFPTVAAAVEALTTAVAEA